ncbi:hypothetical protein [Mycolicibacterium septicum]|uniref:hypothetical protein n=1 Tax=Mycolicibacterium septicum TaxID=98668 RepID=UPI001AF2AE97|nr:hypothetical protein [Mycolicibacterium septicum]QRY51778.1 hypothetical protein JVX95_31130 [Mycolicibacterium septicum]
MSELPTVEQALESAKLRGMIWWLASELATDDVGKGGEAGTWVDLAEKYWRQGLRSETRFIDLSIRADTPI